MPIDPQFGEEPTLPGLEPEAPAEEQPQPTIEEIHGELLAQNQALLQELVQTVGEGAVVPIQVRFLDIRLGILQELLFRQIGDQWRGPFAVEYEASVNQFLQEQISAARRQSLQI